ncbi:hypothetical protein [Ruminococcus sp.]|uniref:hypothetical protein n=1 Tax=Ruminococcus sp. TaxID=41978 RepID=UPI003FD860B7
MSFSVTSKIKLNLPLLKQLDKAQQTALRNTTDALLTQIKNTQVMPFDTGNLQNESTFADYANLAEGETKIVSSTPYARRLYFHPEYNFSREKNIAAGGKWLAPWLKGGARQNFCQKAFARFYKQEAGL